MIRTVKIPCQPEEVYKVLTDPIRLLAWLNVTSATTGVDIFHVFEIVEKQVDPPWQVRGVMVHYETNHQIQIEARQTDYGPKSPLNFNIDPDGSGSTFTIEWDQEFISPLVKRFTDPQSTLRLELILQKMEKNPFSPKEPTTPT